MPRSERETDHEHERDAAMKSMMVKMIGMAMLAELMVGCGTTTRATGTPRLYSAAELTRIMLMRDQGDGLADVARMVGGSRHDVREAERLEKARRRDPLCCGDAGSLTATVAYEMRSRHDR